MITAAMREAAYQALVKRGVPIPPNEIDAVLEAAEGARGMISAPMAEEVRRALFDICNVALTSGDGAGHALGSAATTITTHIDDLTRKVAEAEGLLREVDDGGLDNEPAIRKLYANADWVRRRNAFLAGQPLSRRWEWWRVAMTETVQVAKGTLSHHESEHFGEMLRDATHELLDHDKAVTWLGWMQGFLEARGTHRDVFRKINTEAKARPKQEGV